MVCEFDNGFFLTSRPLYSPGCGCIFLNGWYNIPFVTKSEMSIYIAIAAGGSLGAVSRYWMSMSTYQWLGQGFPYGTLMVNLLGSLLMGFLSVLLVHRFQVSEEVRIGLLGGFLSSFTTFSTFAMDTLQLAENDAIPKAIIYVVLSVLLCILGAWAGLVTAKQLI